jgi:hypothetical protein
MDQGSMKPSWISLLFAVMAASPFGCSGDEGHPAPGGEDAGALACPPDFADCDGEPMNGCEGALSTSAENCGACGVKCEAAAHQAPLCSAGACIRVCEAGFADCNGDPADGCEVDTTSDIAHCGACSRSCKNACVKGACDVITLASGQAGPGVIAIDDTSVYWANMANVTAGAGSIMKVAKAGGAAVTLAAKQSGPQAIALDAASIYWVNYGTPPAFTDGAVLTVAKDGSGVPTEIAAGQASPLGIAIQGSALYWSTVDQIMMIDKADPSAKPAVVASGQVRPREIVAAGTALYWLNFGTLTGNMPSSDGSVMMLPQGGAPVALASNLTLASGLTVDSVAAYLYWRVEGAIMRAPLGGGPAEVFIGGLTSPPWRIAADATTVYWTEALYFGGAVNAAAVSTRQKITLAPNQTFLWGIAIDQTSVYWAVFGDGENAVTGLIAKIDR